jgi:flagellar basal-body rod protein FlgB
MDVNNKTLQALAAGIKFREMRQEIISSNVANADTPGYKAKRIEFEAGLARALMLMVKWE